MLGVPGTFLEKTGPFLLIPKVDPTALGRFLFDADVRLLRFEYLQEFPGRSKNRDDGWEKTCWLNMKLMNI